jgi:ABC-type dipeptide/oligopeptide/nickel transport system ATPase component
VSGATHLPRAAPLASERILEVDDLRTYFETRDGVVRAVDGLSFHLSKGETLGIVGESGSGKSITALSLLRLIASPPGRIVSGSIRLQGEDILKMSAAELRRVRGGRIAMIFQEPMSSLNPVMTVGRQIT